jgi:predicted PurR-regulated permease PerM
VAETARRAAVAALVVGGIVVLALALWKLRVLISLFFLGVVIAAAMRPGVETLKRYHVPRGIGVGLHYAALFALVGITLYIAVPRAIDQVDEALAPTTQQSAEEKGIKHDILVGIRNRLEDLPKRGELIKPAAEVGVRAFEGLIGVFLVLATAAYWIFERRHAVDLVTSLVPRPKRRKVRDTWDLIDLKLGAYVRGQLLLIVVVGTVLSFAFWAIGLRYWILVGTFAGIVEIVPVIGPLTAGALAIAVGFTESWQLALAAGIVVLIVRLVEDYVLIPRVLGEAVGLSPLLVIFSVTGVAVLFGEFAVLLGVPIAAVLATLVDVIVRGKEPAEQEVPAVIFPAKESETA